MIRTFLNYYIFIYILQIIWFNIAQYTLMLCPAVGTLILGHGREGPRWWPPFWGFSIQLGPHFITQHNLIDPPLSAEKIGLSLSLLVPEILGLKLVYFITKTYYLTDFKHFVSIYILIFNPIDPFFIDFRSFWPLIFTKP